MITITLRAQTDIIPEGTRTPNLRLRKPTPYPFGHWDFNTSSGTRTRNLTLRRGAPYPLGHGGRKNSLPNTGVETAWVSAKRRKKKRKIGLPGVGFEPTRTLRPADLKSAPLDPSGIQAKKFLRGGTLAHAKKANREKNKNLSLEGLEPPIF